MTVRAPASNMFVAALSHGIGGGTPPGAIGLLVV